MWRVTCTVLNTHLAILAAQQLALCNLHVYKYLRLKIDTGFLRGDEECIVTDRCDWKRNDIDSARWRPESVCGQHPCAYASDHIRGVALPATGCYVGTVSGDFPRSTQDVPVDYFTESYPDIWIIWHLSVCVCPHCQIVWSLQKFMINCLIEWLPEYKRTTLNDLVKSFNVFNYFNFEFSFKSTHESQNVSQVAAHHTLLLCSLQYCVMQ